MLLQYNIIEANCQLKNRKKQKNVLMYRFTAYIRILYNINMKYAVVDIGSNSVRLLVTDGEKSLLRMVGITRLSEGLNSSGRLSEAAMKRTLDVVFNYAKVAEEQKCDRFFPFATEAVRSAENGNEFIEAAKRGGVEIDVLSGEEEAQIGFAGAYTSGTIALIDIGGASTELAIGDENGIKFGKSLHVGCVRLKENFGEDMEALRAFGAEAAKEYGAEGIKFDDLYCIGGSASTIASIDAALEKYDEKTLHHRKLTRERVAEIIDMVHNTPMDERDNIAGLEPKRKDITVCSGVWLLSLMDYLGADSVINSETSNTEGYLKYRLAKEKD